MSQTLGVLTLNTGHITQPKESGITYADWTEAKAVEFTSLVKGFQDGDGSRPPADAISLVFAQELDTYVLLDKIQHQTGFTLLDCTHFVNEKSTTCVFFDPNKWKKVEEWERKYPVNAPGSVDTETYRNFKDYEFKRLCYGLLEPLKLADSIADRVDGDTLPEGAANTGTNINLPKVLVASLHMPNNHIRNLEDKLKGLVTMLRVFLQHANEYGHCVLIGGDTNIGFRDLKRRVSHEFQAVESSQIEMHFPKNLVGIRVGKGNIDGFILIKPAQMQTRDTPCLCVSESARMLAHKKHRDQHYLFDHEPVILATKIESLVDYLRRQLKAKDARINELEEQLRQTLGTLDPSTAAVPPAACSSAGNPRAPPQPISGASAGPSGTSQRTKHSACPMSDPRDKRGKSRAEPEEEVDDTDLPHASYKISPISLPFYGTKAAAVEKFRSAFRDKYGEGGEEALARLEDEYVITISNKNRYRIPSKATNIPDMISLLDAEPMQPIDGDAAASSHDDDDADGDADDDADGDADDDDAIIQLGVDSGYTDSQMRRLVALDNSKTVYIDRTAAHAFHLMALKALVVGGDDGVVVEDIRDAAVEAGRMYGFTSGNVKLHIWRAMEFMEKQGQVEQVGEKLDKHFKLVEEDDDDEEEDA